MTVKLFLTVLGHVCDWRQKIARTESQTGEVGGRDLEKMLSCVFVCTVYYIRAINAVSPFLLKTKCGYRYR